MSMSGTISEIFIVKESRDLETGGRRRSRSLKMAPFDRSCTTFYWSAIVSIVVPFSSYLTLNNRDIEIWVIGHWKSSKLVAFEFRKLGCGFLFAFHNNYGSILHHFRDKARCWSKAVIFLYPLHSTHCHPVWCGKTRMVEVPDGEKRRGYVQQFRQNTGVWQTDGQTDGRADILPQYRRRYAYASRGKKGPFLFPIFSTSTCRRIGYILERISMCPSYLSSWSSFDAYTKQLIAHNLYETATT